MLEEVVVLKSLYFCVMKIKMFYHMFSLKECFLFIKLFSFYKRFIRQVIKRNLLYKTIY